MAVKAKPSTGGKITKTTRFNLKKETPGAVAYEEVDMKGKVLKGDADGALIGGLYLRKAKLGGAVPQSVEVTVSYTT